MPVEEGSSQDYQSLHWLCATLKLLWAPRVMLIQISWYGQLAALLVFGFLKCSEFLVPDGSNYDPNIHLSLTDVSLGDLSMPWTITLQIKVSKTDQYRAGTSVVLAKTNTNICLVDVLLDYLFSRGPQLGPSICLENGKPLHRHNFTVYVQKDLTL